MDIKRFTVTGVNVRRGFGFATGDDQKKAIFFHFRDVASVSYDDVRDRFDFIARGNYPLSGITNVSFRAPRRGDELMARLGKDEQGRPRLMPWTFLQHFQEVDARLPRCSEGGCDNILTYYDEDSCSLHCSPDDFSEVEDDGRVFGFGDEVYGRALAAFGGNTELAREAAELYPGDFI